MLWFFWNYSLMSRLKRCPICVCVLIEQNVFNDVIKRHKIVTFRQTLYNVIISLKIIYAINMTSLCDAIDVRRERTVTPRTESALTSKSLPEIQRRHQRRRLI